jgi:molybdenum cofactor cytidylyltransferase
MRLRRVPLGQAGGHVLGHNVSRDGRRLLRKGRTLGEGELGRLADAGLRSVLVADLEAGDVTEDEAARAIATVLAESGGLEPVLQRGGRATLRAPGLGLLGVSAPSLFELNSIAGVTLATLLPHSVTIARQAVATLKIIPFALAGERVRAACRIAASRPIAFEPLLPRRVLLLLFGASGLELRLRAAYAPALRQRLARLACPEPQVTYVALDDDEPEEKLGAALSTLLAGAPDLLIVAGETATMDEDDLLPIAIRRAGGKVDAVGAPVFPGNLLLLGRCGDTAILGAPGCVRSPAANVVDLLLPRLLAGQRIDRAEVARLGLGGLLSGQVADRAGAPEPGAAGAEDDDGA